MASLEARLKLLERDCKPAAVILSPGEFARLERLYYGHAVQSPSIEELVAAFDDSMSILVQSQTDDGGTRAPRPSGTPSGAALRPESLKAATVVDGARQGARHSFGRPKSSGGALRRKR
ncbi:MAG: hypothetical protein IT428_00090 [Planctomycetaceae bacterium]|nr:hypothetical protein [Planctomycetaceae bacterium]